MRVKKDLAWALTEALKNPGVRYCAGNTDEWFMFNVEAGCFTYGDIDSVYEPDSCFACWCTRELQSEDWQEWKEQRSKECTKLSIEERLLALETKMYNLEYPM